MSDDDLLELEEKQLCLNARIEEMREVVTLSTFGASDELRRKFKARLQKLEAEERQVSTRIDKEHRDMHLERMRRESERTFGQ